MLIQSLLSANQSITKMQTMQSARAQMEGAANVLRIESKQDNGDKEKLDAADALEEKSSNLLGDLMGEVNDVNETLKPDEEVKAEEKQKEQSPEKDKKADTVTLSDIAAGYRGNLLKMHPVIGEPVIYDSNGSETANSLAKSAPTLEVTA